MRKNKKDLSGTMNCPFTGQDASLLEQDTLVIL